MKDDERVLRLTGAEALVLFEWIARNEGGATFCFEDPAEQRVVWRIEAELERTLTEPLRPDYAELVALARRRVLEVK